MTLPEHPHSCDSNLIQAAKDLRAGVSGEVRQGHDISGLTSFRLGGPASIYVDPLHEKDLQVVGEAIVRFQLDCLVLGKGTNVLISDKGFPGLVLRLGASFDWIHGDPPTVTAGGACALPQVANWAARRALTGLEFAVAIPASVGGAVRMNAGAHGFSVSDVVEWVEIAFLSQGRIETVSREQLQMIYRDTSLGPNDVVCSANFRLRPGRSEDIAASMRRFRTHRIQTQPLNAPNAGSMFRNPTGESAGRLIEAAGLKGSRVGAAEVSLKHANFIVAGAGCTAQDVFDLMVHVQAQVRERFGISLVPEVRVVGEFDRAESLSRQ